MIHEDKVILFLLRHLYCLCPAIGSVYLHLCTLQQSGKNRKIYCIVIDCEHACFRRFKQGMLLCLFIFLLCPYLFLCDRSRRLSVDDLLRQFNCKSRAFPKLAFNPDRSAHRVNQSFNNGKAEPDALNMLLR